MFWVHKRNGKFRSHSFDWWSIDFKLNLSINLKLIENQTLLPYQVSFYKNLDETF